LLSLLHTLRLLVRYWKRVCLQLWSCWTLWISWPAIGKEFACCCGPCWTVDVDGPYVEGVDRLDTSYKGRSVGRVSLWDASISDAIGTFSPCGTAVVWPFRLRVVFYPFGAAFFFEKLSLEGFEIFLVASSYLDPGWRWFFFDFF
jgi:hypothetical protein